MPFLSLSLAKNFVNFFLEIPDAPDQMQVVLIVS